MPAKTGSTRTFLVLGSDHLGGGDSAGFRRGYGHSVGPSHGAAAGNVQGAGGAARLDGDVIVASGRRGPSHLDAGHGVAGGDVAKGYRPGVGSGNRFTSGTGRVLVVGVEPKPAAYTPTVDIILAIVSTINRVRMFSS